MDSWGILNVDSAAAAISRDDMQSSFRRKQTMKNVEVGKAEIRYSESVWKVEVTEKPPPPPEKDDGKLVFTTGEFHLTKTTTVVS